jgi:hypothetical protein
MRDVVSQEEAAFVERLSLWQAGGRQDEEADVGLLRRVLEGLRNAA